MLSGPSNIATTPASKSPTKLKAAASEAIEPGPVHVVKQKDTLGAIALQMVRDSGVAPTKANLDKALEALKAANPANTANDKKLRIGVKLMLPKLTGMAGWPASAGGRKSTRPPADQGVIASKQMNALGLSKRLSDEASKYSRRGSEIDEVSARAVSALLAEVKKEAPELLDTPQGHMLQGRMKTRPRSAGANQAAGGASGEPSPTEVGQGLKPSRRRGQLGDEALAALKSQPSSERSEPAARQTSSQAAKQVPARAAWPEALPALGEYISAIEPEKATATPAQVHRKLEADLELSSAASPTARRQLAAQFKAYIGSAAMKTKLGGAYAQTADSLQELVDNWARDPKSIVPSAAIDQSSRA